MSNRPTLKTIAQIAGLSHVAVSKALRDAPDISAATKERVKKIADELGYTPNVAARNLYLKRTTTIGMVVPVMGENTAYDHIFNEISAAAADLGYCVMLGSSRRSVEMEVRHCRMMVGNQVGAIIVAPSTGDVSHIKAACGPTPVILIGGKTWPEEEYAVMCDYRHSGELAVEHLAGLGHQRITLLTWNPGNRIVLQKEEGFSAAMERRGLVPKIVRTGDGANTMQVGRAAVEQMLERRELPTALWCASDYMAIGAIKALKSHGLGVPEDISVVGHDDLYCSSGPGRGLTTLHTPMTELGKAAVRLAIALIEQEKPIQPRQVFRPSLVVRNSTGPARA